jgi:hypothetical protein
MADWPAGHRFVLFELQLAGLKLLDWYGGAHMVAPREYWAAELAPGAALGERALPGAARRRR